MRVCCLSSYMSTAMQEEEEEKEEPTDTEEEAGEDNELSEQVSKGLCMNSSCMQSLTRTAIHTNALSCSQC